MNLEVVKSITLTILVLLSILLTFGLWNYQPVYDRHYNAPHDYVNEVDLGGKEVTKRDIIEPRLMIFHNGEELFGFTNLMEQQKLYKEMQGWVLYDFQTSNKVSNPQKDYEVELIFPTPIPMEMVKSLFTFDKEFTSEDLLPSWSFERISVLFNEEHSTLTVQFNSVNGREQSSATVNNSTIYNNLMSYMEAEHTLTEYITFEESDDPIYIPKDSVEMIRRSLAVEDIQSSLLVDALFSNPTLVSHNIRESSFSDGQRALKILQEGRSIEYYNPIESGHEPMAPIELLDKSIDGINDHKGWTEEYHLVEIDQAKNKVRYRMHYSGYPVYNNYDLSIIEQQWRDQDLHLYRRLLFRLNDSLGGDAVTLPSGLDVIDRLKNNKNFDIEKIKDIQIAYKLIYSDDASYSVILEPHWYIDYNDKWLEVRLDELDNLDKGGE